MPEAAPDLKLHGCTPEPLMAYLKALGILRWSASRRIPSARLWEDDVFRLHTAGKRCATTFFLKYRPTPIVTLGWRLGFLQER